MDKSSFDMEFRVRKQFAKYSRTVLKNAAKDYVRSLKRHQNNEILFSELTMVEKNKFIKEDDNSIGSEVFRVLDYDIRVKNDLLIEALKYLPDKKRDVVLLYFYMDMTENEIAGYMNLVKSTVCYHRETALRLLKMKMEDLKHEKDI